MLAQLTPKERVGYAFGIGVFLFFVGYVGAQNLKRPPEIVFEGKSQPQAVSTSGAVGSAGVAPATGEIVVHVAGAVKSPGVLRLSPGDRVEDALKRSGGTLPDAILDDLNLAAPLIDGTQLYVPAKDAPSGDESPKVAEPYRGRGSSSAGYSANSKSDTSSTSRSKGNPAPAWININTASASELDRLPGVGPATAAKILDYRKLHGGFTSIEELLAVKGIGPKKLADMRKYVRL